MSFFMLLQVSLFFIKISIMLNKLLGGKTSISLFGEDPAPQNTYQKSSQMYAPPPQSTYQAPSYKTSSQSAYQEPASYGSYYQKPASYASSYDSIENKDPYTTSQSSAYCAYAPPKATESSIQTFGSKKVMRSEHNLGGDGDERFSVKVHHPPGGGGSLNLFGGYSEPTYKEPAYKPKKYSESAYEEPEMQPAGYGSYGKPKAPLAEMTSPPMYNYYSEEQKQPMIYSQPPSGFTSSSSYSVPKSIEPSDLSVSSTHKVFGKRVESGNNSGPHTDKSSIRVHAPPGGVSNITF